MCLVRGEISQASLLVGFYHHLFELLRNLLQQHFHVGWLCLSAYVDVHVALLVTKTANLNRGLSRRQLTKSEATVYAAEHRLTVGTIPEQSDLRFFNRISAERSDDSCNPVVYCRSRRDTLGNCCGR